MICVALGAALRMGTAACELAATPAGEAPGLDPGTPGCPHQPQERPCLREGRPVRSFNGVRWLSWARINISITFSQDRRQRVEGLGLEADPPPPPEPPTQTPCGDGGRQAAAPPTPPEHLQVGMRRLKQLPGPPRAPQDLYRVVPPWSWVCRSGWLGEDGHRVLTRGDHAV